eukprot:1158326-Pelagomonas_calceolata.AAC.11
MCECNMLILLSVSKGKSGVTFGPEFQNNKGSFQQMLVSVSVPLIGNTQASEPQHVRQICTPCPEQRASLSLHKIPCAQCSSLPTCATIRRHCQGRSLQVASDVCGHADDPGHGAAPVALLCAMRHPGRREDVHTVGQPGRCALRITDHTPVTPPPKQATQKAQRFQSLKLRYSPMNPLRLRINLHRTLRAESTSILTQCTNSAVESMHDPQTA